MLHEGCKFFWGSAAVGDDFNNAILLLDVCEERVGGGRIMLLLQLIDDIYVNSITLSRPIPDTLAYIFVRKDTTQDAEQRLGLLPQGDGGDGSLLARRQDAAVRGAEIAELEGRPVVFDLGLGYARGNGGNEMRA